jgi:transposase
MSREWSHYPPTLKDDVVAYCASNDASHSYRAAALHFNIKGGHKLVRRWCNAAPQEQKEETRGRKRKLTVQEVKEDIREWVIEQNKENQHVDYDIIRTHIKGSIGVDLSPSTVKRYTHDESNITWKEHTLVGPSDGKLSHDTIHMDKLNRLLTFTFCVV